MAQSRFVSPHCPDIYIDEISAEMARRYYAVLVSENQHCCSIFMDLFACQESIFCAAVWYDSFIDDARYSFPWRYDCHLFHLAEY
jgi:hypothetical protein